MFKEIQHVSLCRWLVHHSKFTPRHLLPIHAIYFLATSRQRKNKNTRNAHGRSDHTPTSTALEPLRVLQNVVEQRRIVRDFFTRQRVRLNQSCQLGAKVIQAGLDLDAASRGSRSIPQTIDEGQKLLTLGKCYVPTAGGL